MRFAVRHLTRYRYSAPINLGPQLLRLKPRSGQGALDFALDVTPAPAIREDLRDAFGNDVIRLSFDAPTDRLEIESRFTLATAPGAPPAGDLAPYLAPGAPDDEVADFAAGLRADAPDDRGFAEALTETLFARIRHEIRDEGGARPPRETLALGHGACRDIAVLFVETCRLQGLPARFVSGYQAESSRPVARRYMHAWPEVHLAGEGWRAFDPTRGHAVGETHVALAAAPDQAGTMPLEGGFTGPIVRAELDFDLSIETAP